MKVLALDTSTSYCSVALFDGDHCYARHQEAARQHHQVLLNSIREVMIEAQLTYDDLDFFAVGVGPGSFTGVRIGISIVHGLAYGIRCPVFGFSSMQAMAQTLFSDHPADREIHICLDARMSGLYYGQYRADAATVAPDGEERFLDLANEVEIPDGLKAGDGWSLLGQDATEIAPNMTTMLPILQQAWYNQHLQSPEEVQAVYLRPPHWQKTEFP